MFGRGDARAVASQNRRKRLARQRRLRHDALHPRRRVRSAHRPRVRVRRVFIRRHSAHRVRSNGARILYFHAPFRASDATKPQILPIAQDCRPRAHTRARAHSRRRDRLNRSTRDVPARPRRLARQDPPLRAARRARTEKSLRPRQRAPRRGIQRPERAQPGDGVR